MSNAQLIQYGSFEESPLDPGAFFIVLTAGSTDIDDWTVTSGSIDYNGTYWEASDGDRSLDMSGSARGAIEQTVSTTIGDTLTLEFDLAGNPEGAPVIKELEVDINGALYNFDFDVTGNSVTDMGWEQHSIEFEVTASNTTIAFRSLTDGFYGPTLDNGGC